MNAIEPNPILRKTCVACGQPFDTLIESATTCRFCIGPIRPIGPMPKGHRIFADLVDATRESLDRDQAPLTELTDNLDQLRETISMIESNLADEDTLEALIANLADLIARAERMAHHAALPRMSTRTLARIRKEYID